MDDMIDYTENPTESKNLLALVSTFIKVSNTKSILYRPAAKTGKLKNLNIIHISIQNYKILSNILIKDKQN